MLAIRSWYQSAYASGGWVRKVTSSHAKKQTVILSETELDTAALAEAIRSTGYQVGATQKEPYKKKGLFG